MKSSRIETFARAQKRRRHEKLVDLRDGLLELQHERTDTESLVVDGQPFVEFIWNTFDPTYAMKLLLRDEDELDDWAREIALKAFVAWVVTPNDRRFYRAAAAIAIGQHALALDDKKGRLFPQNSSIAEAMTRLGTSTSEREFLDQVYYPVGGFKTMLQAPPSKIFYKKLSETSRLTDEMVRLVGLIHYRTASQETSRRASINATLQKIQHYEYSPCSFAVGKQKAYSNGKKDRIRDRSVRERLSKFKPSLAFIYAAHHVKTDENITLLECIVNAGASSDSLAPFVQEWFGKARFVSETVLDVSAAAEDTHPRYDYGSLPQLEIIPPILSEHDRNLLLSVYGADRQRQ